MYSSVNLLFPQETDWFQEQQLAEQMQKKTKQSHSSCIAYRHSLATSNSSSDVVIEVTSAQAIYI